MGDHTIRRSPQSQLNVGCTGSSRNTENVSGGSETVMDERLIAWRLYLLYRLDRSLKAQSLEATATIVEAELRKV